MSLNERKKQKWITILANSEINKNKKYIKTICEYFDDKKITCSIANSKQDMFGNYYFTDIPTETKILISLGGDGTVLQAAKVARELNIPLFGFNTGTLGFLAANDATKITMILDDLIKANCYIEERNVLAVYKDGECLDYGLNDVIVARDGFSRIVSLSVKVDGEVLNKYCGDGLIVATPTGSTGYNLSLGGPIVSPKSSNMIITPIACHSLFSRSVILSENETVEIEILKSRKTQDKEAILTVDGRRNIDLHASDIIFVKSALQKVKFLKFKNENFFTICNKKLK